MLIAALIASAPLYAMAGTPKAALDGNCPVCLVKMNKLVKGDPDIWSVYDGRRYLFPSTEQKRTFEKDPTSFVPALGGNCTVCKVETGTDIPGKPEHYGIHDGRLYLFATRQQKETFDTNPDKYADTDLALDGNCPVCLVKSDKLVPGKPEYASIYDGQRYLFPSPEQKWTFDNNPAWFAPAMGGNCTVCKVEKDAIIAGNPRFFEVHNKRLYMFPSAKQLQMFRANPDKYANADIALNGYCPVCKIDLGKDVKGKPEFAVDYKGKRYLFPGRKQLEKFQTNPTKYAIAG